jgi:hypothetical protein
MKRQSHRDRHRVDSQLVGSDLVQVWRRRIIICRTHFPGVGISVSMPKLIGPASISGPVQ